MNNGFEKDIVVSRAAAIQDWMILRLSETIGVKPAEIDPRLSFTSFGLSSLVAYTLTGELAEWIGRDLPATLFWEYPTISALSEHLAEAIGPDSCDLPGIERAIAGPAEPEED
jgi:acyl carrier protein